MNQTEWVRVRDEATGHHITVARRKAESHGSRYLVLDEPATDRNGRPLPAKTLHRAALAPVVVSEPVPQSGRAPKSSGTASETPAPLTSKESS